MDNFSIAAKMPWKKMKINDLSCCLGFSVYKKVLKGNIYVITLILNSSVDQHVP